MRQLGTDLRIDPFSTKAPSEQVVGPLPDDYKEDHARWLINLVNTQSHNFCAKKCLNFN